MITTGEAKDIFEAISTLSDVQELIDSDEPLLIRGVVRIDGDGDGKFMAGSDPAIEGGKIELPKFCDFEKKPDWMGFNPSGYIVFPGGFQEVQAGQFDGNMASGAPVPMGDIVLRAQGEQMKLCIDLDRAAGKVRRHEFLAQ